VMEESSETILTQPSALIVGGNWDFVCQIRNLRIMGRADAAHGVLSSSLSHVWELLTLRVWRFTSAEQEAFFAGMVWAGAVLALGSTAKLLLRREEGLVPRRKRSPLYHLDQRASISNAHITSKPHDGSAAKVYKIVLTGGTSAGKSSAAEFLAERLRKMNFCVYMAPEVPTMLFNAGCPKSLVMGRNENAFVTFEASMIELQLQIEETFARIAKATGQRSVIIFNRGIADASAFIPQNLWPAVVNFNPAVKQGLLTLLSRYDLIIHMVTAASGAEVHFVGPDGIPCKEEKELENARALDDRVLHSYRGHPLLEVIDNKSFDSFGEKLERVLETVVNLVNADEGTLENP